MAKKVAQITSKIVEFTGNEETRAFIGRPVTMQNTTHGVVYAIGNTGYVLTSKEYKLFVAAGAIAQPATSRKKESKIAEGKKAVEITNEDIVQAAAQKAEASRSAGVDIDAVIKKEQKRNAAEKQSESAYEFGHAKYQRVLATSSFLQDYQGAEFKLDTPKHVGFFDKTEDFGQKLTGFFDRIGKKGRDRIIDSMND